jgi:hypothetical protein
LSLDPTKWQALLALLKTGKPVVASFVRVKWSSGTKYYGSTAYSDISPFRDIKTYTDGNRIEPRIMGDPFLKFEINGDIRTQNIELELDDTDGEIKALFKANGAAECDLFYFWPHVDLLHSPWWGQILPPSIYGRFTQKTVMTNGYKPPELMLPNRPAPKECPATYGFHLDTLDKVATNLCPKDNHLGGSVGLTNDKDCPKDEDSCFIRLGSPWPGRPGKSRYFAGLNLDAALSNSSQAAVPASGRAPGYLPISKGNNAIRNKPTPWVFGTKHMRSLEPVIWRLGVNPPHPEDRLIYVMARIGEGPIQSVANLKINDSERAFGDNWTFRLGERGQGGSPYPGLEFQTHSGMALIYSDYGYVDKSTTADSLSIECNVVGYNLVAVYSDEDTFTRIFSDDRIWCLTEMYTNQKCGLRVDTIRFNKTKALFASTWGRRVRTFTNTFIDGETRSYSGRRTAFDAVVEGRPAADVIKDVCRSGRISIPFQEDGQYSIVPFRAFTDDELDDAIAFTDHGPDQNIVYDKGQDPVQFSSISDDKVINEIALTFEEANNFDIARTIYGNDPVQQRKASKILGSNALSVITAQFAAFGVRHEHEAVTLLYHLLRFGEMESGGTLNNCFVTFNCPYEWAIGLPRYDPFKLDLATMEIPDGPNGQAQVMTATAVGTATASANITVTVTAAGLAGSPIAVPVAITNGDTPSVWTPKVVTALIANEAINNFFDVKRNGTDIVLTARIKAANDATWNTAIAAGSTGITSDPTSTATTAGVADTPWEWFRCTGIRKLDNHLAEISGIAYNKLAMNAFETEAGSGGGGGGDSMLVEGAGTELVNGLWPAMPGLVGGRPWYKKGGQTTSWNGTYWSMQNFYHGTDTPFPWDAVWTVGTGALPVPDVSESADLPRGGFCSIDDECPDGYVCRNGVCVPDVGGKANDPGIADIVYGDGFVDVTI